MAGQHHGDPVPSGEKPGYRLEYIQEFYCNQYLEILNFSESIQDFISGGIFQIRPPDNENHYINKDATLYINDIKTESGDPIFPSEVDMNIRIGGVTYEILDSQIKGFGIFKLNQFDKSMVYDVFILANQKISFNLSYQVEYFRKVYYEIFGNVTYHFSKYSWNVKFFDDLEYYQMSVDSSLTYARVLPTRVSFYKDHYSQWYEKNLTFHGYFSSHCNNPYLRNVIADLRRRVYRYRFASIVIPGHKNEYIKAHSGILEAAFEGKSKKAGTLMTKHVRNACKVIVGFLKEFPAL